MSVEDPLEEQIFETVNSYYSLKIYSNKVVLQRIGSFREAVYLKTEPVCIGTSYTIEKESLVIREGARIVFAIPMVIKKFIETVD